MRENAEHKLQVRKASEHGNILASSLMVMLAMNLLAVTLVQTSMREFKLSEFKTIDSSTFYLAESCINNTVEWFENLDRPPTALPYNISKDDISHLYNGTESQQMLNKLSKYSYDCTTTSLSTKSTEANEVGEGENVGAQGKSCDRGLKS